MSWNLPPTYKSALPFGPTQTYNSSGVIQTTNVHVEQTTVVVHVNQNNLIVQNQNESNNNNQDQENQSLHMIMGKAQQSESISFIPR